MKQFIFIMLISLLLISCDTERVTGTGETINTYHEQIQGFWKADSMYEVYGDSLHQKPYFVNYIFDNDTLTTRYLSESNFLFTITGNQLDKFDFYNNSFLSSYQIVELNDSTLRMKANWNNTIFKWIRQKY